MLLPENKLGTCLQPVVWGIGFGVVLAAMLAMLISDQDLHPGGTRIGVFGAATFFLVPLSVGTAYALRSIFKSIRTVPSILVGWLALVVVFTLIVAIFARRDWEIGCRFEQEGRKTEGVIQETHPENHDRLLIKYSLSGVDYQILSAGPRVARSYRPGERIPVYYFASAPANGFCVDPTWRPDLVIASWVLAAGVIPIWFLGLFGGILKLGDSSANEFKSLCSDYT